MRNAKLGERLRTISLTTKYHGRSNTSTADNLTIASLLRQQSRGVTIEDIMFGFRIVTKVCIDCESVEVPDAEWIKRCDNCYSLTK